MSHLIKLKPGAARVAIGYLQKTGTVLLTLLHLRKGRSVPIVPVGLNYTSKINFRSEVLIK